MKHRKEKISNNIEKKRKTYNIAFRKKEVRKKEHGRTTNRHKDKTERKKWPKRKCFNFEEEEEIGAN